MVIKINKFVGIILFISGIVAFLLMVRFLDGLSGKSPCSEDITIGKVAFAHDLSVLTITFTDEGVLSLCSTVLSGGTVIWVNKSTRSIQVSSDPHPVHTDNQELSDGKFVIHLESGQSVSVTLTRRGIFGFHDHIKPSLFGQIIVR